jgi:hypothetical protein
MDNVVKQIASPKNLELAWRRITSASNIAYKNYFRHLYAPYELELKQNLDDLSKRLIAGSFRPTGPIRVYQPKPSGLQRPLSILHLEDQILLQAMSNIFQWKLQSRRKLLHYKSVYSNIPATKGNVFFLEPWYHGWEAFHDDAVKLYKEGYEWVAKFDLSAFYDTISHSLLLSIIYPRSYSKGAGTPAREHISAWLSCWCSGINSGRSSQGLPQGPIASDFLAECIMLPIDLMMRRTFKYLRYVDDIMLFGKTEKEVREAIMRLEIQCREHGLIPQSSKIKFSKLYSADELQLDSISLKDDEVEFVTSIKPAKALNLLTESVDLAAEQPILNRSKLRFAFFRATPSAELKDIALSLLPRFPEHTDALVNHLLKYPSSDDIFRTCKDIVFASPYEYVKGQMFHLLANIPEASADVILIKYAIEQLKQSRKDFMLAWGAARFLIAAEAKTGKRYTNFVKHQPAMLQGLVISEFPSRLLNDKSFMEYIAKRTAFEANIPLAMIPLPPSVIADIGALCNDGKVPKQSHNAYHAVGFVPGGANRVDPIDELLRHRFMIPKWKKWHLLFHSDYSEACTLLSIANAAFDTNRTEWLAYQNSFHNRLFNNFNASLLKYSLAGYENPLITTGKNAGNPKNYGNRLNKGSALDKTYPNIARGLREVNQRRNTLPSSHPYDLKTGGSARHLKIAEQRKFSQLVRVALTEMIAILDPYL